MEKRKWINGGSCEKEKAGYQRLLEIPGVHKGKDLRCDYEEKEDIAHYHTDVQCFVMRL